MYANINGSFTVNVGVHLNGASVLTAFIQKSQ